MRDKEPTFIEYVLHVAEVLKSNRSELIKPDEISENMSDKQARTLCARVALAKALSEKPKGFQFRALIEEWDNERLVREMY